MTPHTKEPWSKHIHSMERPMLVSNGEELWTFYEVSIGSGDTLIATVHMRDVAKGFPSVNTVPECDANARRIIACINACAHLTTEELEEMANGNGQASAARGGTGKLNLIGRT